MADGLRVGPILARPEIDVHQSSRPGLSTKWSFDGCGKVAEG